MAGTDVRGTDIRVGVARGAGGQGLLHVVRSVDFAADSAVHPASAAAFVERPFMVVDFMERQHFTAAGSTAEADSMVVVASMEPDSIVADVAKGFSS